ncbi:MAG TPA: MarR family transcriptional regulator [Candidatus Acidoferrales bacterium]|nr:MarR family transcriptional regulator [Candidatus Acidoferrales bacterium]
MKPQLSSDDYRALAEFRYQIRCFLTFSEQAARSAGLEPQQYVMLLAIRGLPEGREATIRALAERLQIRHHSAVELIDRLVGRGLVRRVHSPQDRRNVLIHLTARGERILERLAQLRLEELRATGPALVRALDALIERTRESKPLPQVVRAG